MRLADSTINIEKLLSEIQTARTIKRIVSQMQSNEEIKGKCTAYTMRAPYALLTCMLWVNSMFTNHMHTILMIMTIAVHARIAVYSRSLDDERNVARSKH